MTRIEIEIEKRNGVMQCDGNEIRNGIETNDEMSWRCKMINVQRIELRNQLKYGITNFFITTIG